MTTSVLNTDFYKEALLAEAAEAKESGASSYLLRRVELALSPLARGRYGLCLKCDEPIEKERLDTVPWALFCTGCQRNVDTLHHAAEALRRSPASCYWTEWQMEDAEQPAVS